MTEAGTPGGKIAMLASLTTIAIGLGALAGWLLQINVLSRLIPGAVSMNPTTAGAFILAGTSLGLSLQRSRIKGRNVQALILTARACALIVMLTGLIKYAGYLGGVDVPLDHWLPGSNLFEAPSSSPNRMAPNTSLNFLLIGSALLFVDLNNRFLRSCFEIFVAVACLGALVAILGHAYHVHAMYDFGKFSPMSFYTGSAFLVITCGYFLAHTDRGLLAILVGSSAGGTMARVLLPAAILIPSALGWLIVQGQGIGLYRGESGEALFAVGNIVIFISVVCWSARGLFLAGLESERAEKALEWQTALLKAQINSSIDGILIVDQGNKKVLQNQRLTDLFKIPPHIAKDPDDSRQLQWVASVVKDSAFFMEKVLYLNAHPNEVSQDEIEMKDGTRLERYSAQVVGKDGACYGRIWTFRDITKRRQAEESFRLLNSAVMQSDEVILITEADLNLPGPRIVFVNPAFTRMTGYEAAEVVGQTPRILQGPRTSRAVLDRLRGNLERGGPFEGETVNYRKDGTPYDLEWKIAPLRAPDGNVTHFVAIQRDITARRKAERDTRLNEERYRSLVEATTAIVWETPPSGEFIVAQPGWTAFTGQTFEELGGLGWLNAVHPEDRAVTKAAWAAAVAARSIYEVEHRLQARDQTYHNMLVRAVPILDKEGAIVEWMGVHTDITRRKRLESQLLQSQKQETVGKLAGGIAHEFNSILTAIIGQSELLLGDLPPESRLVKNATEIHKAAERAAVLTRQLLAYGRKQTLRAETLDLGRILKGMEATLRHFMGEIQVSISSSVELALVKADAAQIEEVIMSMALNAREAMPGGGSLTLDTSTVSVQADSAGFYPELKPGDYVLLAISDSGIGMSSDVVARIFEPFFSTKEVGQGAGLGLSTSYGIIKQSGGHISVYSEPSHGTTFKIYLPQVDRIQDAAPSLHAESLPRGTETILLVENDPALREMGADLLERLGYRVLAAADGVEALGLAPQRDVGRIDLLFTDVVMPHMSGRELSERVRLFSPDTKILFTSAYSERAVIHQGILEPGIMLLQKPFAPSALARKIRDILDQPLAPSL